MRESSKEIKNLREMSEILKRKENVTLCEWMRERERERERERVYTIWDERELRKERLERRLEKEKVERRDRRKKED